MASTNLSAVEEFKFGSEIIGVALHPSRIEKYRDGG
jgi:hypothetical protein